MPTFCRLFQTSVNIGCFSSLRKRSHCSRPPWASRHSDAVELTGTFIVFKDWAKLLIWPQPRTLLSLPLIDLFIDWFFFFKSNEWWLSFTSTEASLDYWTTDFFSSQVNLFLSSFKENRPRFVCCSIWNCHIIMWHFQTRYWRKKNNTSVQKCLSADSPPASFRVNVQVKAVERSMSADLCSGIQTRLNITRSLHKYC